MPASCTRFGSGRAGQGEDQDACGKEECCADADQGEADPVEGKLGAEPDQEQDAREDDRDPDVQVALSAAFSPFA